MTSALIPTNLPANAVGFVITRPDRRTRATGGL